MPYTVPISPLACSALNERLTTHNPKSTSNVIGMVRKELQALDDMAQSALDDALQSQRGEVVAVGTPGFSLPSGASQCPQSEYVRWGPLDLLTSGSVFTSFASHYCIASGKYMYEIMVFTEGSMQIGFCGPTNMFLWDDKKGVGDFPFTVGYDGGKCQLHNVGTAPAGWKWTRGDTVSVTFDLDIGEVTYYQNGKRVTSCHLPTVKSLMNAGRKHSDRDIELCYFPAVSMAPHSECGINLGGFPFSFPVEGFSAIDTTFEFLFTTWIPRLGTLDRVPAHLEKYKYVIATIILEKVMEDPETHFMDFVACFQEYLVVLSLGSTERALELIDLVRQTLPEEMMYDITSTLASCSSLFSSCISANELSSPPCTFNLAMEGLPPHAKRPAPGKPNVFLTFFEFVIDHVPEAFQCWSRSPKLADELIYLADLKIPNDMDLNELFPAAQDESTLTREGMKVLYAQQEHVGRVHLKPDELARNKIFIKILSNPEMRTKVAGILTAIIAEVKEAKKNQKRGPLHSRYTERMIGRLFFHIVFAIAEKFGESDDKTIAEVMCPLSVLKMPTEFANFAGVPHNQLMTGPRRADFSTVPDLSAGSPESLMFLACELYTLVVKTWMVDAYNEIVSNHVARQKYLEAASCGQTPHSELATLLENVLDNTRRLSWTMSSLFLAGFHRDIMAFASLCFRMVRHYADTPYAQYIPVMYVECATDLVHFCRRTCPRYAVLIQVRPDITLFFLTHFRSAIIHHQPTREYILMSIGGIVDMQERHRRQVAKIARDNLPILRRFYSQVIDQFSNPMAWTLVVNIIFRQNSGNAFCMVEADQNAEWATVFQESDPIPAESFTAYQDMNQALLDYFYCKEAWGQDPPDSSPLAYFKSAITHSNWCITELSSVVANTNVHEPVTPEIRNKRQRGASIFDYAVKVLHILEGIVGLGFDFFFNTTDDSAGTVPAHNIPPISAASKAMLVAEVAGQCLERFAKPGNALSCLAAAKPLGLEKLSDHDILAPIVGLLFNMMGPKPEDLVAMVEPLSTTEAIARYRAYTRGDSSALPAEVLSYVEGLVKNNVFFSQIPHPRLDWDHECVQYALTKINWEVVCRNSRSNSRLLRFLPLAAIAYEALAVERERLKNQFSPSPQLITSTGEEDDMCAICCASPLEVVFEPCGHSSCRPCIERHQINDLRCFFCKVEVTKTVLIK